MSNHPFLYRLSSLLILIVLTVSLPGPVAARMVMLPGSASHCLARDPYLLFDREGVQLFPPVVSPDPFVQVMIDQVSSVTASTYNRSLAGELPVWVDDASSTITTRFTYSDSLTGIQLATSYVGQHLEDLGLEVEYHIWDAPTNPNVIGEITGSTNPKDIFIIGGHLDAVSGSPGADDNASGSAAVMIAADIFSQYQWDCTLRFAFWTGEEQGLLGSSEYAERSFSLGEDVIGVLNLDMIGWNTHGSPPTIDLHANQDSVPDSMVLAQQYESVIDTYELNLIPEIVPNGSGASDHASFWDYGYDAILGIEDTADFSPYYHTSEDTFAHIDLDYFTEFVRASVGAFAHMSDCLVTTADGYLGGQVVDEASELPLAGAGLIAQNALGVTFSTLTGPTGVYTKTLPAGTYTVTASALSYLPVVFPDVVIFSGADTIQDFALDPVPCQPLTQTAFSWEPLDSTVSQPITFTASSSGTLPVSFAWDFGDGSLAEGMSAVHTYVVSGDYTVTLKATNRCSEEVVIDSLTVVAIETNRMLYLPLINSISP